MHNFNKFRIPAALLVLLCGLAACTPDEPDTPADDTTVTTATDTTEAATTEADATEPDGTEPEVTEDTTATEEPTEAETPAETEPETTYPADEDVVKAERETLSFAPTITVTESGGSATAKAANGLTYTVTGYSGISDNTFTFIKGLTLTFDPSSTAADFNRFTLGYTSTQPLKGTVTYTESGSTRTDDFYLEAGTDTFSCVIGRYLSGKMGKGITQMTFETCNDSTARFALCVLSTEEYPVYGSDSDTYYIENGRYKLGIRLGWGGGINYIEDKDCPVKRLTNLVNQADTGRLIQQSYYGVLENSEYTAGFYNGSKWAYNPVQGGDVAQNHSRIIDIVVTEYSVYVKSQPQDWSKDNEITPSYMENTYTVYSDRIQVDNRFVDFSGWTHRYCHQELPAFYTVSYLSRFSLYNGTKPWTNDTLSYRDDLGFWGDSTYYSDCTFLIKNSNTETWCAWTSPTADFGIGLYVPNVDSFLAGRHAFNNSMSSTDGACNYVAPVNTIMLVAFDDLEYSYLITTGSVEEIRATFTANKDFADNASLHDHYQSRRVSDSTVATNENSYADLDKGDDQSGTADALSATLDLTVAANASHVIASNNSAVAYKSNAGATALTVKGTDPNVTVNYGGSLSADRYKTLEITYMIPTANSQRSYICDLFLCAGSTVNPDPNACVRSDLICDGEYHTLTVDLSSLSFWNGDIHKLRFDFFDGCASGDVMYVKSIVLR